MTVGFVSSISFKACFELEARKHDHLRRHADGEVQKPSHGEDVEERNDAKEAFLAFGPPDRRTKPRIAER